MKGPARWTGHRNIPAMWKLNKIAGNITVHIASVGTSSRGMWKYRPWNGSVQHQNRSTVRGCGIKWVTVQHTVRYSVIHQMERNKHYSGWHFWYSQLSTSWSLDTRFKSKIGIVRYGADGSQRWPKGSSFTGFPHLATGGRRMVCHCYPQISYYWSYTQQASTRSADIERITGCGVDLYGLILPPLWFEFRTLRY